MTPGTAARGIDEDAVEQLAVPPAARLARIGTHDRGLQRQPSQVLLHAQQSVRIAIHGHEFPDGGLVLENMRAFSTRRRTGVENAHSRAQVEQPGSQLCGAVLHRHYAIAESRYGIHIPRLVQANAVPGMGDGVGFDVVAGEIRQVVLPRAAAPR